MKNLDSVTPNSHTKSALPPKNAQDISRPLNPKPSTEHHTTEATTPLTPEIKHVTPAPTVKQDISLFSTSKFSTQTKKPKSKKVWGLKFFTTVIIIAILVLGGLVTFKALNISDKIFVGQKYSFFQKLKMAFVGAFGGGEVLIGENLGQVNILLLGIGGEGHDGPYLTDTMMVAQIKPDSAELSLTSIPRDLLTTLPQNYGQRKINAAFAEGYNLHKDYNEAGKWARETAEKVTGLKIPYFAVIDFSGFEKAIDMVGGLDIYIENSFTDSMFPNDK